VNELDVARENPSDTPKELMRLDALLLSLTCGFMSGCAPTTESGMSREDLKAIKSKVAEFTPEEVTMLGVKPEGDVVAYTDRGPEHLVLRKADNIWKVVGKERLSSILPELP
jgi:hypothetical protein